MAKKEFTKQLLAGSFFIIGLILTLFFILTIGKNKGIGQKKFQIQVHFSNVGGLSEGAPVRLAGVNIGNVDNITFIPAPVSDKKVSVKVNIYQQFKTQLENQPLQFVIKTEGILGEKLLEIYEVSSVEPVNLNEPINGEDPFEFADLADAFAGAANSFTRTATDLSQINIVELTEVMNESSKALLVTSKGINDVIDELTSIAFKAKRLLDRVEQKIIDGDLFSVF